MPSFHIHFDCSNQIRTSYCIWIILPLLCVCTVPINSSILSPPFHAEFCSSMLLHIGACKLTDFQSNTRIRWSYSSHKHSMRIIKLVRIQNTIFQRHFNLHSSFRLQYLTWSKMTHSVSYRTFLHFSYKGTKISSFGHFPSNHFQA